MQKKMVLKKLREFFALRMKTAAILSVAGIILMWPLFYNSQAFFFPDTSAYIKGAAEGVSRLTGCSNAWLPVKDAKDAASGNIARTSDSALATKDKRLQSVGSSPDKMIIAGRSVYYGILLYISSFDSRFRLTAAVQAVLVVLAIGLTLHTCGLFTPSRLAAAMLLLALTPAALFISFLMPDIFAALTILSCANLLAARKSWSACWLGFWAGLLLFSLLAHSSHVLLAGCFIGFGLVCLMLRSGKIKAAGVAVIAAAQLFAYLGNLAFEASVERFVGEPPIRPPFLTVRMIADGPGYQFAQDTCPGSGYTVCRFMDRLTVNSDIEELLWSSDPAKGMFAAADPATRRALADEQYRFAAAVLRQHCLDQLLASMRNAARLFFTIGVREFQYSKATKKFLVQKLPADVLAVLRDTPAFRGTVPIRLFTMLSYAITAVGAGALGWLLAARARRAAQHDPATSLVMLLTAGVIANAAICGSLSGVFSRYQARVAWLLPFAAMLLWFARRKDSN